MTERLALSEHGGQKGVAVNWKMLSFQGSKGYLWALGMQCLKQLNNFCFEMSEGNREQQVGLDAVQEDESRAHVGLQRLGAHFPSPEQCLLCRKPLSDVNPEVQADNFRPFGKS